MRVRGYRPAEVATFAAVGRPLLAADPVRHTDTLTVLDGLLRQRTDAARLAEIAALLTVHDERGVPRGAALRTAGRPLLVSALAPEHAAPVDAALAAADPGLPGVTGPAAPAEALAAAVAARTGAEVRVDMRMRLFALAELVVPARVPGTARRTGPADDDLLGEWLLAFRAEATRHLRDPHPPVEWVRVGRALGDGWLLWEVDGRPVAVAAARRPLVGMSRIGPVYTDPARRGRGYGAAVTAAAVEWAQRRGARHVVLFVDHANDTTNRLYPRLGFRPVHEVLELSFLDVDRDRDR